MLEYYLGFSKSLSNLDVPPVKHSESNCWSPWTIPKFQLFQKFKVIQHQYSSAVSPSKPKRKKNLKRHAKPTVVYSPLSHFFHLKPMLSLSASNTLSLTFWIYMPYLLFPSPAIFFHSVLIRSLADCNIWKQNFKSEKAAKIQLNIWGKNEKILQKSHL